MAKKKVLIRSLSPHAIYPDYLSPWEDVLVQICMKRKKVVFSPCICSLTELDNHINLCEEIIEIDPFNWRYEKELRRLKMIKESFNINHGIKVWYDDKDTCENEYPIVYVPEEMLDKPIIEKAIEAFLASKGFKRNFRLSWKRPKTFVLSA